MTGKAFEYAAEGGQATLTGPALWAVDPRGAIRYELTMRSAKEKK
jgi:hypothetical protein